MPRRHGHKLHIVFVATALAALFMPTLLPWCRLTFFAPFLIMVYYEKALASSLWLAFLCGIIVDLQAAHLQLGLVTLSYCLTTWILYARKRFFFEDKITTIPLMTFFFSILSTLILAVLFRLFEGHIGLSWLWVITDLFIMPVVDGFYALAFFTLPSLIERRPKLANGDFTDTRPQ